MRATVKTKPFTLPNYLRIEGPFDDSQGIDVGALFPTDADAATFWDECKEQWLNHVGRRRMAIGAARQHPRDTSLHNKGD